MYLCMNCHQLGITLDYSASFFDIGLTGRGKVIVAHCTNCGSEIYTVSEDSDISNVTLIALTDIDDN